MKLKNLKVGDLFSFEKDKWLYSTADRHDQEWHLAGSIFLFLGFHKENFSKIGTLKLSKSQKNYTAFYSLQNGKIIPDYIPQNEKITKLITSNIIIIGALLNASPAL